MECPAALGLRDHADDLGQQGVGPYPVGADEQAPIAVERAADHLRPRLLLHGNRLTGNHGLIDRASAFGDSAIDGQFLARSDAQQVARPNLTERDVLFSTIRANHSRRLRGKAQEPPDGTACLRACP